MKKVFLWIQKNTSLGLKRYLDDDYFIPDINNSPMNSWFNEINVMTEAVYCKYVMV